MDAIPLLAFPPDAWDIYAWAQKCPGLAILWAAADPLHVRHEELHVPWPRFIDQIDKDEGSSWRAFDCGHWVQTSKFQREVIEEMRALGRGGKGLLRPGES